MSHHDIRGILSTHSLSMSLFSAVKQPIRMTVAGGDRLPVGDQVVCVLLETLEWSDGGRSILCFHGHATVGDNNTTGLPLPILGELRRTDADDTRWTGWMSIKHNDQSCQTEEEVAQLGHQGGC